MSSRYLVGTLCGTRVRVSRSFHDRGDAGVTRFRSWIGPAERLKRELPAHGFLFGRQRDGAEKGNSSASIWYRMTPSENRSLARRRLPDSPAKARGVPAPCTERAADRTGRHAPCRRSRWIR